MKFSTDWDVNYYKTDYESEEHWELRKKFMEVHKDKFPEDELVCLAQVFTNVEFLGCRYPEETMRTVAELSEEVATEYREEHSKRIKRTFVKASDAAEQRAKGRRKIKVEIYVGGVLAGSSKDVTAKEAKSKAYDAALKKLKQECYVIKPNPNPDRIQISKNNQTIVANLHKSSPDIDSKLDSNNIGYKMMLKQGWNGGGLGLKTQGREEPVDFLVKNNRKGFGNDSDEINANYFRNLLTNYIKSEDIRDLYFESGFTKEERAALHQIASSKNLKSSSHGKEPQRHLVISKKTITPFRILEEVLINKNAVYMNKYEVKVPRCKTAEFPNHAKFKPS